METERKRERTISSLMTVPKLHPRLDPVGVLKGEAQFSEGE